MPTDELKKLYAKEGKADRYFEGSTPCVLYRAQSRNDFKKDVFIMQPHPGYVKKDANGKAIRTRLPDVNIEDRDGKQVVLGCRTTAGDYRGLSLFDAKVTWLGPAWINYVIPAGTEVPPSLVITKDHFIRQYGATHYTIAPKDDMPLELFIQTLKVIANRATLIE